VIFQIQHCRSNQADGAIGTGMNSISAHATFIFETEAQASDQEIPAAAQSHFRSDFAADLHRLELWARAEGWAALPISELHVSVSTKYRISKALYPAWSGHPGHMQFPAHRVRARTAAIAHELTHVFFPNSNRFLAEGLAVYIQAQIGANCAFPNFGEPLHLLALEKLRTMSLEGGAAISSDTVSIVADLDRTATPSPLVFTNGESSYREDARGQGSLYALAGSFVQFLVETRGLDRFCELYVKTPMLPSKQVAGSAKRWLDVYGAAVEDLEVEWRATIARLGWKL
jgi:hypothetical protein